MNITLTVRGNLEDDVTLQEILAILYKKNVPCVQAEETQATVVTTTGKQDDTYPLSDVGVVVGERAPGFSQTPTCKPAVENPEFEAAVEEAVTEAPEPQAAAVDFATVTTAARKALNAGKRDDVAAIFEAHGSATLKDISEIEYAAVLAELEAL